MKRILAIDGGGIKGAWPAAFLADLEEATGQRVLDMFDLIVGTSTGAIVALGLGLGMPASDIVRLYAERGPVIFEPPGPFRGARRRWRASGKLPGLRATADGLAGMMAHLSGPKYPSCPLKTALVDQFQNRTLGESQTRLVIPSFNAQIGQVYLFKTSHHPRFERDHTVSAVDVALATAAAPTYFSAHATQLGSILVDGGVWANNPTGLAVVEGVAVLGWKPREMRVLSLGCTDQPLALPRGVSARWFDLTHVIELMFRGQAEGSMGTAKLLLGHTESEPRLFRRTQVVDRGTFAMDSADQVRHLAGLGREDARQFYLHIARFSPGVSASHSSHFTRCRLRPLRLDGTLPHGEGGSPHPHGGCPLHAAKRWTLALGTSLDWRWCGLLTNAPADIHGCNTTGWHASSLPEPTYSC
jgi:hypothetical protein